MNEKLANLRQLLQSVDKFAIFCANDFACLLVQYCMLNGLGDKIVSCVVSNKGEWRHTPNHILGVPVVSLNEVQESKDFLFVVAFLDDHYEGLNRINANLVQAGYNNIYFMSEEEFRGLNESLADFSADINFLLRKLTVKVENLSLLVQNMPMVAETHKKSFGKYKNCHKGQTVVVCASGPTLNKYKYNPDFIHIGVNQLILQDRIKLDYFFQQDLILKSNKFIKDTANDTIDFSVSKKYIDRLSKVNCIKFLGQFMKIYPSSYPLPFGLFSDENYNNYYVSDTDNEKFCTDIRYKCLNGSRSTIFPALQFALFTNPKRILIVGADGYDTTKKDNYFTKEGIYLTKMTLDMEIHLKRFNKLLNKNYQELKDFVGIHYPNTEIIMVNPVHFKGIFKEITTDAEGNLNLPD